MSLTKAELAANLSEKFDLSKSDAKMLVDNFFEEIAAALERGEHVRISGFGNFELKDKQARPGRNPKTGVECTISSRCVVVFKPGQKLKSTIAGAKLPEDEAERSKEPELEEETV